MVIFQTSREGSALFSDVVPVPRAVEFKMATGCKFLSLAASFHSEFRHIDLYYFGRERLSFNMAANMRGATCAGTKTSKVPTEVRSLLITYSVLSSLEFIIWQCNLGK